MDCEQVQALLSARMDGEIQPEDRARLESHLVGCAVCRVADEAGRQLDADLRRTFSRQRQAATSVVGRIVAQLPVTRPMAGRARLPWLALFASAAAGFALAVLIFRPWHKEAVVPVEKTEKQVLELAVATGSVEVQLPGQQAWQEVAAGAAIEVGCHVRTSPQARCELRTTDGSEVRLNTDTNVLVAGSRQFQMAKGQLLAVVTPGPTPFEVQVPDATVVALGTQFDVLCQPAEVVLTVVQGATRVQGRGEDQEVKAGHSAKIVQGRITETRAVHDLVRATDWVHDILVRKGRDNPELARRVDDLLAQIGQAKTSFMSEDDIRGLGDRCVVPLTRYICSDRSQKPQEQERRVVAARILADVAQPWSIPDLIGLLADKDPEVRYQVARGLQRLTGETQGLAQEKWRTEPLEKRTPAQRKWQDWWKANKTRFPGAP